MDDLIKRADAMGVVQDHFNDNGFKGYDDGQKMMDRIKALPSAENSNVKTQNSNGDLISRADVLEGLKHSTAYLHDDIYTIVNRIPSAETTGALDDAIAKYVADGLMELPSADADWIPCSERLPRDLLRVNVTWINHNPPVYYQRIKDIPQTDTAVRYNGKWYWWDATVIDVLAEYGEESGVEQIDKDIEVVAWMPLPKPYREDGEVEECG